MTSDGRHYIWYKTNWFCPHLQHLQANLQSQQECFSATSDSSGKSLNV